MLRRRLHLVGRSSASAQSISLLAAQRNQSNNGGGDRLHRYVRDGAGADSPRSAGRGGPSPASSAAPSESMDWAARMQRELMSEVDPLGGLAHKDYYRDPATGYSPQYAPRNFADGGAIAYHHASSSMDFTEATAQRTWRDHDVASMTHHARDARAHSRQLHSSQERQAYVEGEVPSHRFSHALPESTSRRLADLVHNSQVGTAETLHQHSVLNRYQSSPSNQANLSSVIGQHDMAELVHDQMRKRNDDLLAEGLQIEHGVRDKERFDFSVMQRTSRIPFPGYDKDRLAAQHRGSPYGAQQLPPMVSASSVEEAQKNLRSVGPAAAEAEIMKAYARNTVTDTPQMGEGLTESIASQLRLARDARTQEAKSKRDQRFGLGRQGALVQDGGPDRRTQQKNVNDERLVDALRFSSDAYRRTETDEHVNPYVRRNTEKGVGHLLNNSFDIDRREDRLSHGQQDITERNTIHYGTPIQQSIDEFVLTHRNARGERPLDYFKPFPHFRALRLSELYSDTEGFSMMKQRPEFLEWELFTRFRAHHQQRRELALLHGLEPVANETATERERRRQALDELCEKTPFDPSRIHLKEDEVAVGVDTLRNWFGAYFLPSPTIVERVLQPGGTVGLFLQGAKDELGTEDTREHILSSRYLNQLLLLEGYQHRIGRGYVSEVAGRAPEPEIKHAQSPHILRHFDADERAMYEEYVAAETNRQLKRWESITRGRRFIPERKEYGEVVQHGMATPVVDLEHTETSAVLTISAKKYESELQDAMKQRGEFRLDGDVYRVVVGSERVVTPLSVRLESGEVMDITDEIFSSYDLEVAASGEHNHGLNFGVGSYTYNRGNYVETQDVLWEQATAEGTEGWSPATLADGLRPGLPVRARRHLGAGPSSGEASWTQTPNLHEPNAGTSAAAVAPLRVVGDYQHARVVQFQKQPFFNPDPKLLTVEFKADGVVQQVPLSDVLIWQRQTYGPERTVGEESRRYNANGIRRYVDVRHPNGDSTDGEHKEAHFLEKYEVANSTTSAEKYRSTKQITEVDQWTRFDTRRPENYRPIGISHRRDYIRGGYMHRYTPWEWISVQEADQPIIRETIRQDDIGASHVFSLQRYWRYKARPHGYIRNFENEVRDMFQYVDGVTPWKQAQKIRTYWEVREHHPMPQFNRPEVAMHRNTPGLLPAHMWETDKKTGKVKAVKDSVRDYQTKVPLPQWVQM